jgi:nitrite reductase/ring-hydroxylating ferredoxin subunit
MLRTKLANSRDLEESGIALRFRVRGDGRLLPAIAVRFEGEVRAYVNQCAHFGMELDVRRGHVFSRSGKTLVCAAHGAEYDAGSGACASGPCFGEPLDRIEVCEENGKVFIDDPNYTLAT